MNKEMRRLNRRLQTNVNELLETKQTEMYKTASMLDEYKVDLELTKEEILCWNEVSHEIFTDAKEYEWNIEENVLTVIHLDEHKK